MTPGLTLCKNRIVSIHSEKPRTYIAIAMTDIRHLVISLLRLRNCAHPLSGASRLRNRITTFAGALLLAALFTATVVVPAQAQSAAFPLPDRPTDALTGSELEPVLRTMSLTDRENRIFSEITAGNVPDFLRSLTTVTTSRTLNGTEYTLSYHVTPDYLALGSDDDYFLMPMTPVLAQRLANAIGFTLPTRRMVDQIWQAAPLKLNPQPIPPSDQMTTIPVMFTHNNTVQEQRNTHLAQHPLGTLVAGHKKDVILSNRIYNQPAPRRVVIYGWHYQSGSPIQPVYSGHDEFYADYSHGIRAVLDTVLVNDEAVHIDAVLQDPVLHELLSDEGVIELPFYPLETTATVPDSWGAVQESATSLRITVPSVSGVEQYRVHLSADGVETDRTVTLTPENLLIDDLTAGQTVYVRLQAVTDHAGPYSEMLGVLPATNERSMLLVNGFDRGITGNTRDFVRRYLPGLVGLGYRVDSATNEAIADGRVDLNAYNFVVWILGAESTADHTFTPAEQSRVKAFLDEGGNLLVSGSELAWDLDYRGNTTDKAFLSDYLKVAYAADAPGNQSSTWYQVQTTAGSGFPEFSSLRFDDGSQGSWNVSWPDVFHAREGGQALLEYQGAAAPNIAAVGYKGSFPGSASGNVGSVITMGFPIETVYPSSERYALLQALVEWITPPMVSVDEAPDVLPVALRLDPNYPNPFNAQTRFRYHLPRDSHVELTIYNPAGQRVQQLQNGYKPAGIHEVSWNAGRLASGVYISMLSAGGETVQRSVLLVK